MTDESKETLGKKAEDAKNAAAGAAQAIAKAISDAAKPVGELVTHVADSAGKQFPTWHKRQGKNSMS